MATNQQIPQTTTTKTKKSQTVRQIELLFMLKRQVNIVYKQLDHFESAMKNVAQFNRFMNGYVYVDCNNNNNNQEEESNSKRLQIEFNKFQKNYRFWRKRLRKFDRKLREINLYDKLYDLYENLIIGDCDEPIAIEDLIDDMVVVAAESTIVVDEPPKCSDNLLAKEEIPVFVISDSEDDDEESGHEVLISENDIEVKLDTPEMESFQLPENVTNCSLQKTKLINAPPSSSSPKKIQIVPSGISTIKQTTTEKLKISVRKPPKVVKGITLPASTSSDASLEFNKVANPLNYSRRVGLRKKKKKDNSPIGVVVESTPKLAADKELAIYDRPYKCDFNGCNFAAKTIYNLKSHQISHSDDRPHRCDHPGCGFAAKLSNVLKRHRLTHSDTKPYSCDHCCKRFKHFNSFRVHLELHQFPCEIDGCRDSFRDYNKLLKHIGAIHAKHATRLDIANLNLFDRDGCQMILD